MGTGENTDFLKRHDEQKKKKVLLEAKLVTMVLCKY